MTSQFRLPQRRSLQHFSGWAGFSVLLGTALALSSGLTKPAAAAEQLYFTYGPLGRSIAIADLQTFAETGETTSQLRWYLNFANLEPDVFRRVLTQEVTLSLDTIDTITHTLPGEFVLFEAGQIVHTKYRQANIQALRGAFLVSVSEDNKISLLEFLENYPTPGVYVDGVVLARVARDVNNVIDRLEPTIAVIQELLSSFVCDCQSPAQSSDPSSDQPPAQSSETTPVAPSNPPSK